MTMTAVLSPTLQRVLDCLPGWKRQGKEYVACCPAHGDRNPSLGVREGRTGAVVVECRSQGCKFHDIARAMGLEPSDFFPDGTRPRLNGHRERQTPESMWPVVATFDYVDGDGHVLYQVRRKESPDPAPPGVKRKKSFPTFRPDGRGGWIAGNVPADQRVLYALPGVLEALAEEHPVYVVEGEKKVAELARLELTATSNVIGAGHWQDSYSAVLAGGSVIVLPDNDEPGRKHALDVARSCHAAECTVRVVELPVPFAKGDVCDWIERGGTREQLEALVAAAPVWTPAKPYRRLDALWADPEIMRPPAPRVPYICWDRRSTLLAGVYKFGKSTLAGAIAAGTSNGADLLGEPCQPGRVLIVGLEEFTGDLARRLQHFGASGENVFVIDELPGTVEERLATVQRSVAELAPVLVIIDSLIAWVRGSVDDFADTAQLEPVVQALTKLAHESGVAILILHHGRRSDGKLFGSQAIGAGVDIIAEVSKPNPAKDPTLRYVEVIGRVPAQNFAYRYLNGDLLIARDWMDNPEPADASLRERIVSYLRLTPGAGRNQVQKHIGGKAKVIRDELDEMIDELVIENRGTARDHKYHVLTPSADQNTAAEGPDAPGRTRDPAGPTGDPLDFEFGQRRASRGGHDVVVPPGLTSPGTHRGEAL